MCYALHDRHSSPLLLANWARRCIYCGIIRRARHFYSADGMWTNDNRIDWGRAARFIGADRSSLRSAHYASSFYTSADSRLQLSCCAVINLTEQTTCFIVSIPLRRSAHLSALCLLFVPFFLLLSSSSLLARTRVPVSDSSSNFWLWFAANCLLYFAHSYVTMGKDPQNGSFIAFL